MRDGAEQGLLEAGHILLERARAQAPIGTPPDDEHPGRLKESGRVDLSPDGRSVVVSFNTPYAAKQHEDQRLHHAGGKAKYLEDPLKQMIPQLPDILGGEVRKRVQGRG